MSNTRLDQVKSFFTNLTPLRIGMLLACVVLIVLLISSARDSADRIITSARDAAIDKGVEQKKDESIQHEQNADTIRDERLRAEGEIKAATEQSAQAARESHQSLITLTESKRRYEESRKIRRRVDVGLDDRERDVLTADRELYPDADR